ncbi:MAG: hypothetical protein RBU37_25995, partial [Myxococcota bacterium]|nr:hypothetical protein [Myxococcota bacterium]
MQAIARVNRVNRVFRDKPGDLVHDGASINTGVNWHQIMDLKGRMHEGASINTGVNWHQTMDLQGRMHEGVGINPWNSRVGWVMVWAST